MLEALKDIPLPPIGSRIVGALVEAHPEGVRSDALMDAVYGADPDGGPTWGVNALISNIVHLRRRLKPFGISISRCGPSARSGPGRGNKGVYFLEVVQ